MKLTQLGAVLAVAERGGLRAAARHLGVAQPALTRNVQSLQALQAGNPGREAWGAEADRLLRRHREWVGIEWRDARLEPVLAAQTPFRPPVFERFGRLNSQGEVQAACANARRISSDIP